MRLVAITLAAWATYWGALAHSFETAPAARAPVLLDTDIGEEIDDAFALALLLASPELELRGVTTVGGDAYTKAGIVCQFLENIGASLPVAAGAPRREKPALDGQMQFGLRARQRHPLAEPAVEFLHKQVAARPGELTVIAIGPLTNIARLFKEHPESKGRLKRLIIMGGSLHIGYNGKPPAEAEWNVRADIPAAQAVFASGVPITVVPLDATALLKLEADRWASIREQASSLPLQALYELWGKQSPVLFDPAAVAIACDESLFEIQDMHVEIDNSGNLQQMRGKPNARIATGVRRDELLQWCVGRMTNPRPAISYFKEAVPLRISSLKPLDTFAQDPAGFPARIHVFEDYETDIEHRWWLAGKLETQNVPPGSTRACRGVLCHDFDEKLGQRLALYRAVIFNPVPGPPMGPRTWLTFRYFLRGTDKLRAQIYSLSNGYHRQLPLAGLKQGQWQRADVDLTLARRPDGSGGPLSADERIDDIQFYTDPAGELLIDDIVLYDAAETATAPFPQRILFTGWFDTGRQGVEWPGDFEIVPREPPLKWKAAQAVETPDKQSRWIRLDLRGPRPLGQKLALRFRYRLTGATSIELELGTRSDRRASQTLTQLRQDEWSEAIADWTPHLKQIAPTIDQLSFRIPHDAQLQVDDVLLYEPAK